MDATTGSIFRARYRAAGAERGLACLSRIIVAACVVACGDTRADSGLTSDGETTASTDGAGASETGTDDTGGWPECIEPEDLAIGGLVQSDTWPFGDPPAVEHGTCSIDGLEEATTGEGQVNLRLQMNCVDAEGGMHLVEWGLGNKEALDGRIDGFVGMKDLSVDFEVYWPLGVAHDNITVRDPDGVLLLAGTLEEPVSGPNGWEGVPVGGPAGVEDQGAWYSPFDAFVLRDDLCPDENSDFTGAPGGIARRLGVELDVENSQHLLVAKTQLRSIATADGTYDVLVGSAYRLIEVSCEDCPPVFVSFLIIRTGE